MQRATFFGPAHSAAIAEHIRHIVAASFAAPEYYLRTPHGYPHLARETPFPNMEMRPRTRLVADLVASLQRVAAEEDHVYEHTLSLQVFGVLVFRFHNTPEFLDAMREHILAFARLESTDRLATALQQAYALEPNNPAYLFSVGDGIRSAMRQGSWRAAALAALPKWFSASKMIAKKLRAGPRPEEFHRYFIQTAAPRIPGFGVNYWLKFVWGDLTHIAPAAVELQLFSLVGVGAISMLCQWGLRRPQRGLSAYAQQCHWLDCVRELRLLVWIVMQSTAVRGIRAARSMRGLKDLTVYDHQVAGRRM